MKNGGRSASNQYVVSSQLRATQSNWAKRKEGGDWELSDIRGPNQNYSGGYVEEREREVVYGGEFVLKGQRSSPNAVGGH